MTKDSRYRRRFLQATGGAVTTTTIAVCMSGDGGGNDTGDGGDGDDGSTDTDDGSADGDSGDDSTDTQTQTEEPSVPGEVTESSVGGLSMTEHTGRGFVDSFRIEVTVENTGELATNFASYEWSIAAYDSTGADISTDDLRVLHGEQIEAGDSASIILHNGFPDVEPTGEDVVRYEMGVSRGDASEGEYCQQRTEEQTTDEDDSGSELPPYEFSEGESYTYDVVFGGQESQETWSVTDVSGGEVTVERVSSANGESESQTFTGTQDDIYDVVEEERRISYYPVARAVLVYGQEGELTAGNTFTVDTSDEGSDWDSETVMIEGETTVNGVTCAKFESVRPSSG